MASDLTIIAWAAAVVALAVMGAALVLATRLIAIRHSGGAVDCALRGDKDTRWRPGVAVYETGRLCWYRSYGVGLRPDAVFDRRSLRLVARYLVGDPLTTVVRAEAGAGAAFWLALSPDALTGLLAWLEAAPQARFPGPC